MRRASLVAVLVAAGCTAPSYGNGHLQCGADRSCPSGFYCASDEHCWRDGSGPGGGGDGPDASIEDLAVTGPMGDLTGIILDMSSGGGVDLGGGPSRCNPSSIHPLLCEGFETAIAMSPNGWSQSLSNGTLTIDTTRVFRGASSLKSHISSSAANSSPHADIQTIKPFPIVNGTLYGRVWVYFSPGLPSDFEQFFDLVDPSGNGVSVATDSSFIALDDYATGGVYKKSTTKMPLDRWACIQFQMSQQGTTTGLVSISLDDKLLSDVALTSATPNISHLIFGLDFFSNSDALPAYDAWFDELVVDNAPIACTD